MLKGTTVSGDISEYIFNGLGFRVGTRQTIDGAITAIDYVVDVTSPLFRDLMEFHADGTTKRLVYGFGHTSTAIIAPDA